MTIEDTVLKFTEEINKDKAAKNLANKRWHPGQSDYNKKDAENLGKKGGDKGGEARDNTLSSEEKSKIAREGAEARWGK